MGRKAVLAGMMGIALLLLIATVLVVLRPASGAITVRLVETKQSGQLTTANFQLTNHTSNRYFVFPRSVEVRDGPRWRRCFEFTELMQTELRPLGCQSLSLAITNVPAGPQLRLRLMVVKELRGIKGLPGMLRLKFIDGVNDIPNPFDKSWAIGSHEIITVSDEFVTPQPR